MQENRKRTCNFIISVLYCGCKEKRRTLFDFLFPHGKRGRKSLLKSYGNYIKEKDEFEFVCLRSENMQFLFNHLRLELKDHNKAEIRPGFISRTLVDKDFQHTINSLHFLMQGEAVLAFEGETHTLTAGDVFLIGNHVKCTWEYVKPAEELTLLFNVYLGSMDDIFEKLTHPLILHGEHRAAHEAGALFAENSAASLLGLHSLCFKYLGVFLSQSGVDVDSHVRVVKKYKDVFSYISEHLSAALTVEELAKATGYSVSFFTKCFPKDNGVTVKEYIHDKIMSEAEQLLIYSDLSVGSISDRLGFCEQAYFSRWFKRYKSASPTEYRARIRRITEKQGAMPLLLRSQYGPKANNPKGSV